MLFHTLKPLSKIDLHKNDSLTTQLSTRKFLFKSRLTSLYMVSTPYKFQVNPNCCEDHYMSYVSKQLAPYESWTANIQKLFNLQTNFLRPYVFDLHADDSNPSFKSVNRKRFHCEKYQSFWDDLRPSFKKASSSEIESSPIRFHFIYSINWGLHIPWARCEISIFWNSVLIYSRIFSI